MENFHPLLDIKGNIETADFRVLTPYPGRQGLEAEYSLYNSGENG